MGQINRIPIGYLDLLGTETGGKNPAAAPELISPTLSMNELYASQTLAGKNFALNSVAVGNNNFITVPNDEAWILYGLGANTISPLAGDEDQIGVFLDRMPRSAAPGNVSQLTTFKLISIGVNQTPSETLLFPTPFVIGHGTRVIANIQQRAGGAALRTVNINLTVGLLRG